MDFTRDYDQIRKALPALEHYDKTCLEPVMQGINSILLSTWGTQNYSQVLIITDCGIGMRNSSMNEIVKGLIRRKQVKDDSYNWLPLACPSRINVCCLGSMNDIQFRTGKHGIQSIHIVHLQLIFVFILGTSLYQNMLDYSGQDGKVYLPKGGISTAESGDASSPNKTVVEDMIKNVCDNNYKKFEAILNCGSYFKLECPVVVWPQPLPYKSVDLLGKETYRTISKQIDVCGFIQTSDIGSPVSVSRHLILPKPSKNERETDPAASEVPTKKLKPAMDLEKLDADIKGFYTKSDNNSDDEGNGTNGSSANDGNKESVCVLLHGALKVENMAALVLLNQNWFGFLYSYADNKKKSNLMLMVLQPGTDIIPWLGEFRLLTTAQDPVNKTSFPIKPDKRSYSQNCVVWIKQAGLQADIQKVLRHAKKLPEKMQHFYKELNRIRRAALSLGFIELMDGLACIFEREIAALPSTANPDCALQLKHAALEIRKLSTRDPKQSVIVPYPTPKFN